MAGNQADAADCCQEALIAIVKGLGRYDGRAAFSTWSYRVATNAALDELRRRGRRPQPTALDLDDRPDVGVSTDQIVDRLDIEAVLPQLPEEFRVPVVLRDVAGLDYAEIAEKLNIPPGTVRSRIARGRRQLSELLGNQTPPSGRQR